MSTKNRDASVDPLVRSTLDLMDAIKSGDPEVAEAARRTHALLTDRYALETELLRQGLGLPD